MSTICWVLIQCFPVFCLFPSCSGCVPKTFWHFFHTNYLWPCQKFSQVFWYRKSFCKVSPLRIWLLGNVLFHFIFFFFFLAWGFENRAISPSLEQVMLSQTYVSKWYLRQISVSLRMLLKNFIFLHSDFFPAASWFYVWF